MVRDFLGFSSGPQGLKETWNVTAPVGVEPVDVTADPPQSINHSLAGTVLVFFSSFAKEEICRG